MKDLYKITVAFFITFLFSCDKYLDRKPLDSISPLNYYNTEAHLDAALTGVYDRLGEIYGSTRLYHWGLYGEEGYSTNTSAIGVHAFNSSASDNQVLREWEFLYQGINRANMLLANINKNPDIDQGFRDQVRGETLFLRGYYYFLLVSMYGGVPLILEPAASPNETAKPRSSIKEVYTQILADMEEAEKLVKPIHTLGFGGRVSQSAVRGILARVNLYMAGLPLNDTDRLTEVVKWTSMVMDDQAAQHALNPNYSQIFINHAQDQYDIKESIFEVEYWGTAGGIYSEGGQVGPANGPGSGNPETGLATGNSRATATYYRSFKHGDVRRGWSIANFTYTASGGVGAKTFITATTNVSYWTRSVAKWRREYEVVPRNGRPTPQNYPLLRYADVLLMYAEAVNELQGPTEKAIDVMNTIRKRAWSTGIKSIAITDGGQGYTSPPTVSFTGGGGSGAVATAVVSAGRVTAINFAPDAITEVQNGSAYTSVPEIILSGGGGTGAKAIATVFTTADYQLTNAEVADRASFRKTILTERSFELGFECHRKFDLIRHGIFVQTMHDVGAQILIEVPTAEYARKFNNVSERDVLWPIPASEILLNKAMVQNPGW